MNTKNFNFLNDSKKIELAKKIEKSYWSYYFSCDDWSTDDIVFHLTLSYNFGDDKILTFEEFNKIIDTIQSI